MKYLKIFFNLVINKITAFMGYYVSFSLYIHKISYFREFKSFINFCNSYNFMKKSTQREGSNE